MKKVLVQERVVDLLRKRGFKITTMESCTSGLLISTITDIEGASEVTEGGYVTYSNQAKIEEGIPAFIINKFGVYSDNTALAMASTCRSKKNSDIGIGVTGTFTNVDASNEDSKSGEVYYCIEYQGTHFSEKIIIPNSFDNDEYTTLRHSQKAFVVYHILSKLEDMLLNQIIIIK